MSGELGGFIAAHAQRTHDLLTAELSRSPHPEADLPARPGAFVDAVLIALEDDNIEPLVTVCGLGNRPQGAADRLDKALLQLTALGQATATVADEERLPSGARFSLFQDLHEGLTGVAHRLSTRVARDLSEQVNAQAAAARGPSLSITMHELRRPLTILSSYGQLLATGVLGTMPDSAQVAIEGISASTEMMVRMVNALAEVSRLEDPDDTLSLEDLTVDDIVSAAIEHVGMEAHLRRVALRRDIPKDAVLEGDRRRLALALTNIVSNAVKHSPDESEVSITSRVANDRAHFIVRAQGPGFPVCHRATAQDSRQWPGPVHRADHRRAASWRGSGANRRWWGCRVRTGYPASPASLTRARDDLRERGRILIRPTDDRDHDARVDVIRRAWLDAYRPIFGEAVIRQLFDGTLSMHGDWTDRRSEPLETLVAETDGALVGLLGLATLEAGVGEVAALYVVPECQGRGIGTQLWSTAVATLRLHGCHSLEVWALAKAPARRFYESRAGSVAATGSLTVGSRCEPCVGYKLAI